VVDFTVAICTYNGESRLPKVLERLRIALGNVTSPSAFIALADSAFCLATEASGKVSTNTAELTACDLATATLRQTAFGKGHSLRLDAQEQTLIPSKDEHFSWEVIVIDNNSNDNTAKVVQDYQSNWSKEYPLRYYFEPTQGIAFARRRAIKEAQGSLIGFLDDDNLPTPNWVYEAYCFGQLHPQAGAYGSQVYGEYESKPPENFQRISCFLAIVERGQEPFRYDLRNGLLPVGAGLVIRKQAWIDCVPDRPFFKGVCTTSLLSKGEDLETLSYIIQGGWEIWHNPQMCIYHHIPHWRLEKRYLAKLLRGVGLSRYPIRMLRFRVWQKPLALLIYWVNDLRKLILHFIKYRKALKTNTVAACEMELLLSTLVSPFYYWQFFLGEK
jgi:glycosyltransferase involved in cell wall biosynthesis